MPRKNPVGGSRVSDVASLIMAQGDEAREINERKRSSTKIRFLKAGQKFRGRFLTASKDFILYAQHGDYEAKIRSHACLDPKGKTNCPSCKAGVKRSIKTLIAFYDIETGEIVVKDVAKGNMETVYSAVTTYGDDLTTDTFDISVGEKGAITVMYVKPKKGEEFPVTPEGLKLDEDSLRYVMGIKTAPEIEEMLGGKVRTQAGNENTKIEEVAPNEQF